MNIEDFKKEFLKIQEKAQTEGFSKKDNQQFIVETLLPWSKKLGYTFTKQDFITFDKTQNVKQLTGISQEELANVSGGLGLGVLGTLLLAFMAAGSAASDVSTSNSTAVTPTDNVSSGFMNFIDSYDNLYPTVKLSNFASMSSSENFSPADYNFGNWTSKTGESASSFLMQYSNAQSPDGSGSYGNPYYDVTKPGFQIYNNTADRPGDAQTLTEPATPAGPTNTFESMFLHEDLSQGHSDKSSIRGSGHLPSIVNSIPEVSSDKLTEGSATGTEVAACF